MSTILNDIKFIFWQGIKSNSVMWPWNNMLMGMTHEGANAADLGFLILRLTLLLISSTRWHIVGSLSVTCNWRSMSMIYAVCALALPFPLKVLERIGLTKKYSEWIKIAHPQPLDDKQGHVTNKDMWQICITMRHGWNFLGRPSQNTRSRWRTLMQQMKLEYRPREVVSMSMFLALIPKPHPTSSTPDMHEYHHHCYNLCRWHKHTTCCYLQGEQVTWGENNPFNASYVILIIMIFMCKLIYC